MTNEQKHEVLRQMGFVKLVEPIERIDGKKPLYVKYYNGYTRLILSEGGYVLQFLSFNTGWQTQDIGIIKDPTILKDLETLRWGI